MWKRLAVKSAFLVGVGSAMGLLVGVGMMIGSLVALSRQPATPVFATASSGGANLAVATGSIDEDVEGFYTLDFLTGNLQCMVLGTRGPMVNKFIAVFRTNVIKDLGLGKSKKPDYLMVTGYANVYGVTGVTRPALAAVYVADGNTGKFAAYSFPWNRTFAVSGRPQTGNLILLGKGTARPDVIRE